MLCNMAFKHEGEKYELFSIGLSPDGFYNYYEEATNDTTVTKDFYDESNTNLWHRICSELEEAGARLEIEDYSAKEYSGNPLPDEVSRVEEADTKLRVEYKTIYANYKGNDYKIKMNDNVGLSLSNFSHDYEIYILF